MNWRQVDTCLPVTQKLLTVSLFPRRRMIFATTGLSFSFRAMVGKVCSSNEAQEEIRKLELEYRSEGLKKANNLVELLPYVRAGGPGCLKAIHATRRTLISLEKPSEFEKNFRIWLHERRSDYSSALLAVLKDESASEEEIEAAVAAAALTHRSVWASVLTSTFEEGAKGKVGELVLESFVSRFADLRATALELVKRGIGSLDTRLHVLSFCAAPAEVKNAREREEIYSEKELRRAFGCAWVAVLEDEELSSKHRREVLERIPKELIPNMSDPLKLADFLSDSYNNGKDVSVAVSALDGLFILISQHGLDYPLFYQKLYALMSPNALFHAEGRTRFRELAALFLRQGAMLPGGLVAAFIKRLVRLALHSPAESALWCLRLALDLLHKHQNVSYLVHRAVNLFDKSDAALSAGQKRPRAAEVEDPFDDEELDPQSSKADQSSLWELEVLASHISPAVSTLVSAFSKDVRKKPSAPPGSLADYGDLTFTDIFQAEFKRRAKSSHLAYDKPGTNSSMVEISKKLGKFISWS